MGFGSVSLGLGRRSSSFKVVQSVTANAGEVYMEDTQCVCVAGCFSDKCTALTGAPSAYTTVVVVR